ncbi:MAG: motility associated factor glycosyltransferase family protein, partial [Planctomycetes bacterium]|nr:motility associated factor glycosyltransferase family protein [Planctomycetota bacterium]
MNSLKNKVGEGDGNVMERKIAHHVLERLHKGQIAPGQIDFDPERLKRISLVPCSLDGYCIQEEGERNLVFGSRYSERRFVEKQLAGIEIKENTYYYTLGFDTGLYVQEFLKRMPKSSHLLVFEPDPEMFFRAITARDYALLLDDRRLSLVVSGDKHQAQLHLRSVLVPQLPLFGGVECLVRREAFVDRERSGEWTLMVSTEIRDACFMEEMSINTLDLSIRNFLRNFLRTIKCQDWKTAREKLRAKPLVLVGVGPSLVLDRDKLRSLQEWCHIGCVDNGLKTLLAHDIFPDFVFLVDWQEATERFFEGVSVPSSTVLVAMPGAWEGTIKKWPGKLLFMPSRQLQPLAGELTEAESSQFHGTNVGMLAFQFGLQVRAAPVILVGYDLFAP